MNLERRVPDGGWGWTIVFGSFAIHMISDGIVYTAAIFYKAWIEHYNASVFLTTMVLSLMAGASLFVGPIAAAFIAVFGCRKVALFGSITSTVGLTLSAYAPSINFLLFSLGFMTGSGFGLLYIASVVVITEYFDKRLALAAGLACCGSSIGIIVFAPLIENLNSHFKWQTTTVILAAISLLQVLFSMTFIRIDTSVKSVEDISAGLVKIASPEKIEENTGEENNGTEIDVENHIQRNEKEEIEDIETTKIELFIDSIKTMFGTKLLLSTRFLIYTMASFLVCLGYLVPPIFLKVRALDLKGVKDERDTHGLLTIIGIGSTIGRVFLGFIADYKWCPRFIVFVVATVICGAATAFSVYCQIYTTLAIYCFFFGLTSGVFIAMASPVISDVFGAEMVANAFGLLALFEGIAYVIGTPFIGLFDSHAHKREFIIAGALMIAGGLSFTLIPTYDAIQGQLSQSSKNTEKPDSIDE